MSQVVNGERRLSVSGPDLKLRSWRSGWGLAMAKKRDVLELLNRGELLGVLDAHDLTVEDRRRKDLLIDGIDRSHKAKAPDFLLDLPRNRLKEMCRGLGLDDSGRAKADIVARLVGRKPPAPKEHVPRHKGGVPRPNLSKPARPPAPPPGPALNMNDNKTEAPEPTSPRTLNNFSEKVSFIWSVADLLRGDYKQSEYGRVILPFLVLRRLDQVLAPKRQAVLAADAKFPTDKTPEALRERMLLKASGETFYNTSKLDFTAMLDDANNAAANLSGYVHGFSKNVRDIMEKFRFEEQLARLDGSNILFLVLRKFVAVDLDPYKRNPDGSPMIGDDGKPVSNVSNMEMGTMFEELIRKFSEQSNETAGEHFTPREVIKFMVTLLFAEDDDVLHKPGIVRTMYDPACGTGGMFVGGRGAPVQTQPPSTAKGFWAGAERRVLCNLQSRHAHQRAGGRQHQVWQLLLRGRPSRHSGGLPDLKSAFWS